MSRLARTSVRAFGTLAVLATTEPAALRSSRRLLISALRSLDLACSRFRDDSELVGLNRSAGRPVEVGETLWVALVAALESARMTAGLVDPTVGRTLRLAGYDVSFEQLVRRDPRRFRPAFEAAGRFAEIELDPVGRTVRIPLGVELDLGASAKAAAADRIAQAAAASGAGVLVAIGGDVAVAGPPPDTGWPVRLAGDHAAPLELDGPVVAINGGGLASSGTHVRRWGSAIGELHHIVDPRSGAPARTPWVTVTVAAASCLEANAAATAAIILGNAAPSWLAERALPARLASSDGTEVCVGNWPADAA